MTDADPPSPVDPPFPLPVRMKNRLYWRRSDLEEFKHALLDAALGHRFGAPCKNARAETPLSAPDSLVLASTVAEEFGFHRRTLGRRIAERSVETARTG